MDLIHNLNNDITTHSRLAESTMLCLPKATHSCLAENTMLHLHRVLTIRAEISLPKCAFKWLDFPGAFWKEEAPVTGWDLLLVLSWGWENLPIFQAEFSNKWFFCLLWIPDLSFPSSYFLLGPLVLSACICTNSCLNTALRRGSSNCLREMGKDCSSYFLLEAGEDEGTAVWVHSLSGLIAHRSCEGLSWEVLFAPLSGAG